MSDEFVSRLPVYTASKSTDFPEFLIVFCQYEECPSYAPASGPPRPFLVHGRTWLRPIRRQDKLGRPFEIGGRMCPYCARTGRVPARKDIE